MSTECTQKSFGFHPHFQRRVEANFKGGRISSNGGGVLLREVERKTGMLKRLAKCFEDRRQPGLIEHQVEELVAQRVYGLALGYDDLNDHDDLCRDPVLALLAGKRDVEGQQRRRAEDRGKALAGKSTLNRLELSGQSVSEEERYKKIAFGPEGADRLLVDLYVEAQQSPPEEVVLDLDATDDPVHGDQEGRHFHGYYRHYCYLPLYIFAGRHALCARLRPSNIDAAAGALEEVKRIVGQLRACWPEVRITLRADSGFCREEIMAWAEDNGVDYVFGLAKNNRLRQQLSTAMTEAHARQEATGEAARVFAQFQYRTRKSWSCDRRVVGKAEVLEKGENPRFVVTSLSAARWEKQALYETLYCARGEMENRIKEQQLELFADRTSTGRMASNQLRLYFSTFAYQLMEGLRRLGLTGTRMARAQCGTIRLRLLKIGALIRISVRRVVIAFTSGCPDADLFARAWEALRC
jgi:hypothetical protein